MDTKELGHLKNVYELTALKYLNTKDDLLSKRLLLGLSTSSVVAPSSEAKTTLKTAGDAVAKTSAAYFAAVEEYRATLLPKGYKEVEMQSETNYDELCNDEDLEAEEAAPKTMLVAIPEGNKELPYCYKHVSPGVVRGGARRRGRDVGLGWAWEKLELLERKLRVLQLYGSSLT